MKNAAAIEAQLVDVRNVGQHKSVKLTLHVPAEQAGLVMAAFGWPTAVDPVPVALARLVQPTGKGVEAETTMASPQLTPALVKPPARAPRNKLAQLAGMLSKTPLFHRYLEELRPREFHDVEEEQAAHFIRAYCSVESRSQILPNTPAGDKFLNLYDDYILWSEADKFVEAL